MVVETHPLTSERWDDLVDLFGRSGAFGGCWCMYWRMGASEFSHSTSQRNKEALHALVQGGQVTGLLAYLDGQPVGWCSVAPRTSYERLVRSRTLAPLDDQPVWSVVCFFVRRAYRGRQIALDLLRAAVAYAAEHGAPAVEAYPVDTGEGRISNASAYTGTLDMFLAAGFRVVAESGSHSAGRPRPIVRYQIGLDK